MFRLLPGAQFAIDDVVVNCSHRHTRVAFLARVSGVLPTGRTTENRMMQVLWLRWGRVTAIETLENVQGLQRALQVVAAAGTPEALAPPLED